MEDPAQDTSASQNRSGSLGQVFQSGEVQMWVLNRLLPLPLPLAECFPEMPVSGQEIAYQLVMLAQLDVEEQTTGWFAPEADKLEAAK